jgi:hypothetical protein
MERPVATKPRDFPSGSNYKMDTRVIYIFGTENVGISCPHCFKIGKISVSNIMIPGRKYKLKCTCGKISIEIYEKRHHPRLNTKLTCAIYHNGYEYFVPRIKA